MTRPPPLFLLDSPAAGALQSCLDKSEMHCSYQPMGSRIKGQCCGGGSPLRDIYCRLAWDVYFEDAFATICYKYIAHLE